jgi:hypothetical protein
MAPHLKKNREDCLLQPNVLISVLEASFKEDQKKVKKEKLNQN